MRLILFLALVISGHIYAQPGVSLMMQQQITVTVASYDTDAQAFFTALEADASPVTLNSTQKGAINQLVLDLKTAGIWTKIKALYPFIGGTAASHKYNLKDPRDLDAAFRLTFFNSPTHSNNGVDWNGSTQYASTHFSTSNLTGTSVHLSYYSEENTSGSCVDIGTSTNNTSSRYIFSINFTGAGALVDCYNDGGDRLLSGAYSDYRGFFVSTRTSSTRMDVYKNGVSVANRTATLSSSMPTSDIEIGRAAGLYTNRQCAFASVGDGLNSTENSAFYTAVQLYQTTIGRQV